MTAKLIIFLQLSSFTGLGTFVDAQPEKRIWVLREPDQIVEHDSSNFAPKQPIKIPAEVFQAPDRFLINRWGQMLFNQEPSSHSEGMKARRLLPKIWFWNGKEASFLEPPTARTAVPSGDRFEGVKSSFRYQLSADGGHLLCFESEYRTQHQLLENGSRGAEIKVDSSYGISYRDLGSGQQREIAAFSFPRCECLTGACLETCPEAEFWAPEGGIGDFFFVTHLIPGQLHTDYQNSFLFSRSGEMWSQSKLSEPLERMLDAGKTGRTFVAALPDVGCCGWENESNDRTLLFREDRSTVLFDERERYANSDYDVSFFTANAVLSPSASFVAMTLSSSARDASDIRLSSDGKADDRQLNRIREAIRALPVVEVLRVLGPVEQVAVIPNAFLIDWISEKEIVFVEGGHLIVFDIAARTRRESQIEVFDVNRVFVR